MKVSLRNFGPHCLVPFSAFDNCGTDPLFVSVISFFGEAIREEEVIENERIFVHKMLLFALFPTPLTISPSGPSPREVPKIEYRQMWVTIALGE